jgi:hypothetical protein
MRAGTTIRENYIFTRRSTCSLENKTNVTNPVEMNNGFK